MTQRNNQRHRDKRRDQLLVATSVTVFAAGFGQTRAQEFVTAPTLDDLRSMSIEELGDLQVGAVSRRLEPLMEAPASVYPIPADAIRRSGAVSLPEVLRLAPNLTVARLDASHYAISARGFNSFESSNKLLVMIDGRSMYTALHGGVFWDQQQPPLGDIARIDVVSGPGGALWGANAFNGVISIVTKPSSETQGALVDVQAGNVDQQVTGRYGGTISDDAHFRVYGSGFRRGETQTASGDSRDDDWDGAQGGARFDWTPGENTLVLQGDVFEFSAPADTDVSGYNVLARWGRPLWGRASGRIRMYYDSVSRKNSSLDEGADTFDVDAKVDIVLGRHMLVAGAGHRVTDDVFDTLVPSVFFLDPESRTVSVTNAYAQDEVTLSDRVALTLGVKYEHSSFSGGEVLPSARIVWKPNERAMFWSAVSRAVRTPSRIDRDIVGPGILEQAVNFGVEEVIAYELGYRGRPSDKALVSISLYYNDYDDLRVLTTTPGGFLRFGNSMRGHGYGVEAWGEYQARSWWRLSAGFNYLEKDLELVGAAIPVALSQHAGNDPDFQLQFRSEMDLGDRLALDVALRAVDDLEDPAIPGYVEVDARIGFALTDQVELSLTGSNLLDAHHPETGTAGEVRRSVLFGARLRF